MKHARRAALLSAMAAIGLAALNAVASAQTFSVLYAFGAAPDAEGPRGGLNQGQDASLLGTSIKGGSTGESAIFSLSPDGTETVLGSFSSSVGGIHCNSGVTLGLDGTLYGACPSGTGSFSAGTIFALPRGSAPLTLHAFNGADGQTPELGAPILLSNGKSYGVTETGGAHNQGTAFAVSPDGTFATLYDFGGFAGDASMPSGALMLASDGYLYGTTMAGGKLGGGTIFRLAPEGLTIVHSFAVKSKREGSMPMGGVVQDAHGKFYGVTYGGGSENLGTVYALSALGKLKTLHEFSTAERAGNPCETLALAPDGNAYGTTARCVNGTCDTSVVFSISPRGVFKILHELDPATEGSSVSGPLYLHTNGLFYGTAERGGSGGAGTVFSLDVGLQPFVNLSTFIAPEGGTVGIYGQGFTSAGTKLVFPKGVKASFKMITPNYLEAIVPLGATSGRVKVNTPSGSLRTWHAFSINPVRWL